MRKISKISSTNKLILGFALLSLGLILLIPRRSPQLTESFRDEPVVIKGFSTLGENGKLPLRIIIPEIGINLEVKKASVIDGYWEVFQESAGWGEGSGIPGEKGNQVIFAHARKGLFLPLRSIKVGEEIYVLTEGEWYKYKVSDVKEVYPNETDVILPTEDERLTLYTCSGFSDEKRLIVTAFRFPQ